MERHTESSTPIPYSFVPYMPFLIGDNLNDYKRDYYVADVAERLNVMGRDRDDYGHRSIVLFGESDPAPTDESRRRLRRGNGYFARAMTWHAEMQTGRADRMARD